MMEEQSEKYLFEEMPVPRAVATLAIPTVISQVVTMIYNLADTFFDILKWVFLFSSKTRF